MAGTRGVYKLYVCYLEHKCWTCVKSTWRSRDGSFNRYIAVTQHGAATHTAGPSRYIAVTQHSADTHTAGPSRYIAVTQHGADTHTAGPSLHPSKNPVKITGEGVRCEGVPVRKGRSSLRVLSSPKARAMVDSFLMEWRRNCRE